MQVDQLVHLVYEGIDEPMGFDGALTRIAGEVRSDKGHCLIMNGNGELLESNTCGYELSSFRDYELHWRDRDPRLAAAIRSPNQVLTDDMLPESEGFERTPIYNDHLRSSGVRHTAFVNLQAGPDLLVASAFMRGKAAGVYAADESRLLRLMVPHLARAIRTRQLLRVAREEREDLSNTLDLVPAPLAILDARGRVLWSNRAGGRLLASGDGTCTVHGVLTASTAAAARTLARCIETARLLAARAHTADVPSVSLPRENGLPVLATFMPLGSESVTRRFVGPRGCVLVAFHDPADTTRLVASRIAAAYELTPTEALLAVTLAEGGTLAAFASARGCTEQTARSHLKRVFEKVGTSRQADLVRLLLTHVGFHQAG